MIKNSNFEDQALLDKFDAENPYSKKSLYYQIRKNCSLCDDYPPNQERAYSILIESVADYFNLISTSQRSKQNIYFKLRNMCKHIGYQLNIEDYIIYLEEFPEPFVPDLAINIIKKLHNRDGVTKKQLIDELEISERTIRNYFEKISNSKSIEIVTVHGLGYKAVLK